MFTKTAISAAVAGVFLGGSAFAQETQRVEVTGSAIKRVQSEGALPVTVVSREQIERSGVQNTEQLLQGIAAISSMGGTATSTGAGSSTYGLASISLRGLGDQRTLVLVNGRRLATFAGAGTTGVGGSVVNVNAIPLAAIERVEVLKDGASAVYGSDAVAGVVNFILKKDYRGLELDATYGTPTRSGGGQSARAAIVGGFGDLEKDRFTLTFSATFEKEKELFAKDREFSKTGNQPPYIAAGATGQGNIQGAFVPGTRDANGVWREGTRVPGFGTSGYGNPLAATGQCESINMFLYPGLSNRGAPYCQFDSNAFVALTPKRELASLTANGEAKVTNNLSFFADALYSRSVVTQIIQPSPVRYDFLTPSDSKFQELGVDPALLIYPSNPNYKIAADYLNARGFGSLVGQPLAITSRVFDFGPRMQRDVATQSRIVAGARGTVLANHDWEAAYSFNQSKVHGSVPGGYFSQVAYARTIQQSNDWNPWSLTQSDAFNQALVDNGVAYTGDTLRAKSIAHVVDARVSGELASLPAGPLMYALGVQGRIEKLTLNPSAALSSGDIAGLGGGIPELDKERKVAAIVGEINVPILKSLEGTLALRNDKYSVIGNATTYKASLRYQPSSSILVRGGLGTGFRAPTLQDLYMPQSEGTSEQFNDPGTGERDLQVPNLTGGNTQLKPERSKQASIGIVVQPTQQLSASVDYWLVRIQDVLSVPSVQEVVSRFRAGDPAYAGLVTIDPATNAVTHVTTTQQNSGNARVRGLDLDVNYRDNFGPGRLDINFAGTYMIQFDQTSPGGVISHKVGTMVDKDGNPVLDANNGGVVLRWKHALTGTWTQGDWAFTLTQNFYKGYQTGRDLNDNQHFVNDQALYDAQVAYRGIKNLKLALGVRNLFDKNPPMYIPVSNQFQAGYDISQYDPRSRFVYLNANYKFN